MCVCDCAYFKGRGESTRQEPANAAVVHHEEVDALAVQSSGVQQTGLREMADVRVVASAEQERRHRGHEVELRRKTQSRIFD